jgi:hypothetical protein
MFNVKIFNTAGQEVDRLSINDTLQYVGGRVYRGEKFYYKGVGVPYIAHSVSSITDADQYSMIRKSDVFYLGYKVTKKVYEGKVGIFQERYQPFFPDFIGACSIKEGMIVINSITFERSSVDVIDCIKFDEVNQQHYYILDYNCNRKHYATDGGDPKHLYDLLSYMIGSNWNFLWDKGAINDITPDGRVSDVADLFLSSELNHKLGTVYSVLYSLGQTNYHMYIEFIDRLRLVHIDVGSYVENSIEILRILGVDVSSLRPYIDSQQNYIHAVKEYLLTGKNCAYCSCDLFKDQGDQVRDMYLKTVQL